MFEFYLLHNNEYFVSDPEGIFFIPGIALIERPNVFRLYARGDDRGIYGHPGEQLEFQGGTL